MDPQHRVKITFFRGKEDYILECQDPDCNFKHSAMSLKEATAVARQHEASACMTRATLAQKLSNELRSDGKFGKEAQKLAQQWEKVRELLQKEAYSISPDFYERHPQLAEWSDGPEEDAMKGFLFWWTWGN